MDVREARRLRQKRKLLLRRMAGIEEFLRGSVVLMKRPCTYPGCRKCASGERHPTWGLTVSEKGKTRTVYLGLRRLDAARRMTENYRRVQAFAGFLIGSASNMGVNASWLQFDAYDRPRSNMYY